MTTATKFPMALLLAAATAFPALAQSQPASPATTPGLSSGTSNPNLAVASVKLDHGVRVSTIVGASVYGTGGQELGKVNDLVMTKGDEVTLAVVSIGGFLGVGSKLVAFPYRDLKQENGRLTLPGVTSDSLNAMPSFEY